MKLAVRDWNNKEIGSVELNSTIAGAEKRSDLMAMTVRWQLAKRRAGTHKVKQVGDISGTTKKPFAQKGTGRARQGSLRGPHQRGGAVIFGPVVRDHGYNLNKKVRRAALISALVTKIQDNKLFVVDQSSFSFTKTAQFDAALSGMNCRSALLLQTKEQLLAVRRVASNIPNIDVLADEGANVYDILRRDILIISKDALERLQQRLTNA
ncbi:MAG: 50S ribosomal protein L4 [Alphaproteobacteria bacterium]|nr:50S ribosomal protein L4 [Alphaproteobacteria bacterium]